MLHIRNWEAFQHYRDRDPTWIKVYNRLLDDADFLALPEAAQAQLVKLWLLASRCKNQIREDNRYLTHALHTSKLYISVLIKAGFLYQSASESPQSAPDARAVVEQNVTPRALAREEVPRTTYKDLELPEKNLEVPENGRASNALAQVQGLLTEEDS